MHQCSNLLNFVHFADDATVFVSGRDAQLLKNSINVELEALNQWLTSNRLSLNVDKTVYMIHTNKNAPFEFSLSISGKPLKKVELTKFLGITIDSRLNFHNQTAEVLRKTSGSLGLLKKFSSFLPTTVKKSLYYAFIYSKLSYAIVAWGKLSNSNLIRFEHLIDKSRAFITGTSTYESNLLNFESIYKYFLAIKTYKILNLNQHEFFHSLFLDLIPTHTHGTRHTTNDRFNLPNNRLTKLNNSFLPNAIKTFNAVPLEIRSLGNINSFKRNLKSHFLSIQNLPED